MSWHCACPRGLALCHHVAAVLYYAHYNVSSTDKEKLWGTPSTSASEDEPILTVEELFGHKEEYVALKGEDKLNINKFKELLGETNVVGFSWLLKPEADISHALISAFD